VDTCPFVLHDIGMTGYIESHGTYQPGLCNIGPAEIRRRRRVGYLGTAASLLLAAVLVIMGGPSWTRLALAAPVAIAVSGFLQAHLRFCAGFGMAGIMNFGEVGKAVRVEDSEASAMCGLVAGVIFALLPI
jgi:hypothetical protein